MSDKLPPTDPDNTRTATSKPARANHTSLPTQVAGPNATTQTGANLSAEVHVNETPSVTKKTSAHATQFTRYNSAHSHSTGFEKAQRLAQQTLNNGMLLKKRFVLEEALGHGGMGTVYSAKDLRKVEAEDPYPYIAIKVLNQDFKDHPDAFVALQQEAAKSHTLAHPNIVTVHDFDRDGDTLFMTMELLEGEALDQVLKQCAGRGLEKPKALKIVRDLCAALTYAHQRQIIHADFKPGNVFVMRDGSAKVLDFGIARAATKESQRHKFDASQLGALTPAYATIEMVNDEPLTFTDDVYALACVIYEIFAGHHPYSNRSAYTAKQQDLKPKRIECLNSREWRTLQRALALDKKQRTATVSEFNREFFPRRNSRGLKVAVFASVIGISGAGWFGFQQYQAEAQVSATIAEKLQQAQTCFARNDFACSIDNARVVINLDPDNVIATTLLGNAEIAQQTRQTNERIARLIEEANACMIGEDYACTQLKAREILSISATESRAQALLEQAQRAAQTAEIEVLVQEAEACLTQGDLSCAILFGERALSFNADHPRTIALQDQLRQAQEQQLQVSAALAQRLSDFVATGQQCLDQKNYSCAMHNADEALALDTNHGPAISLRQSAYLAQQQARASNAKVQVILEQARTCLDQQKNYSCAIAKAEAALDIIPNHREAKEIKLRAEDTQRQLKETGFTIR